MSPQESTPLSSRERKALKVVYTGAFLGEESREALLATFPPVHAKPIAHHMTIAFGPSSDEVSATPVGEEVDLTIVGVAEDEKAQAVVVESPLSKNAIPHITISVADGVSPVYPNELLAKGYRRLATPVSVRARVGAFAKGRPMFERLPAPEQQAPQE